MAFNPFNIFRRNQKAIFAVLTVVIMVMFTLSSGLAGGADFFQWLPAWLGSRSASGAVLCTIDGGKVTDRELARLGNQRVMANQYMVAARQTALGQVRASVADKLKNASPENRDTFRQALTMLDMMSGERMSAELLPFILQQLQQLEPRLRAVIESKTPKEQDLPIARELLFLMSSIQQAMFVGSDLYFVNTSNRDARDRIEFLLWLKMADKLGIQFGPADVDRLCDQEFPGVRVNFAPIRAGMKDRVAGFNPEALTKALIDEFRVRTAQTAVQGPVSGRGTHTLSAAPLFTTPYELFEFYRDQASPATYAVVSVPAANFMDKVTEKPTEAQLLELFNLHKSDEPHPALERPGFKEPRKAKIEWIAATGKEPFYQAGAKEWLAKGELQAKLGGLLSVPVGPAGPAWAATAASPLTLQDPLLQAGYQNQVADRHSQNVRFNWSSSSFMFEALDTSVVKVGNLASVAGGVAGSLLTFGPPVTPAALFNQSVAAHERRARIAAGMPVFLGAVPGPGMIPATAGGVASQQALTPKPLPIEVVKAGLVQDVTEQLARKFLIEDMRNFEAETRKLSGQKTKDRGAVKSYVEEFVRSRGVQHGGPTDFRDEFSVDDDPALAPLKAAMGKGAHQFVAAPIQFGRKFFFDEVTRAPAVGTYKPDFYPNQPAEPSPFNKSEDPIYMTWRTDEKPAEDLAFPTARPKVEAAWKRLKARELAKAEAERIAKEVRESPATNFPAVEHQLLDQWAKLQGQFADTKARDAVKYFKLPNVAQLVAPGGELAMFNPQQGGLMPYQLTPSANLPYPTADMQKALLENRDKPAKTAVVLPPPAKPDDTSAKKKKYLPDVYYVAAVIDRQEKSSGEFGAAVYSGAGPAKASVLSAQRQDAGRKAREGMIALLKTEFKYANENTKLLDESEKRGGD